MKLEVTNGHKHVNVLCTKWFLFGVIILNNLFIRVSCMRYSFEIVQPLCQSITYNLYQNFDAIKDYLEQRILTLLLDEIHFYLLFFAS